MKHKIFFIMLLLIIGNALALNPQIIDINASESIYATPTTFRINIDSNGTTGNINMYDGTTIIDQKVFNSSDTQISFIRTFTEIGSKTLKFSLTNVKEDTNYDDSQKSTTINTKKGYDFKVTGLSTNPSIYLAGTTITIQTSIRNDGDKNFVGSLDVFFFYDGNELGYRTLEHLEIGQTKIIEFDYTLPLGFQGEKDILVSVNRSNAIKEFDITNNTKSLSISEQSIPNLVFTSFGYNDTSIKAGETKQFDLVLENIGGTLAENVLVRIYKDTVSQNSKIHEETINVMNGNSKQNISFTYFFLGATEGEFIAYIDPLNTVEESSDEDNLIKLQYIVEDSNFVFNYSDFIVTLESLQGELNSCQEDLSVSRLEKDVAFKNVASLEVERNNCQSARNTCTNDLDTEINKIKADYDTRASMLDSNLVVSLTYFNNKLIEKDDDIKNLKMVNTKDKQEAWDYALLGYAIAIFCIIAMVVPRLLDLKKKREGKVIYRD